jgi:ferredoxin
VLRERSCEPAAAPSRWRALGRRRTLRTASTERKRQGFEGYAHGVIDLSPLNRIRVEVDRDLCIGSGDCVASQPDVFELDDDGKAVVLDPDAAATDDIVEAASNCPVTAIFVIGEAGDLYP